MNTIFIRRTRGGFLVRVRAGTPYVFLGYDTYADPRGAVARYLDKMWECAIP